MKNNKRRSFYFLGSLTLVLMLLMGCSASKKKTLTENKNIYSGLSNNQDKAPAWNPKVTKEEKVKFVTSFKDCPAVGDKVVTGILKPIRQKFKLPAVAAAIVTNNGIVVIGAVGITKEGTQIPVNLDNRWLIGSCTKAMTSTLIAILVEKNKLSWNSTIAEIFPNLSRSFSSEFNSITVEELLGQRSGLPRDLYENTLTWFDYHDEESLISQRLNLLKNFSNKKLLFKPGTKWSYSNIGYIVLGAVIDKISGKSYEQAMKNYIFKPLNMKNSGFKRQISVQDINHLWSHYYTGKPTKLHFPYIGNSAGGNTYCSMEDWSKFIQDQLNGAIDKSGLLKPSSYKKIQTPVKGISGALGWEIKNHALYHSGTDILNFAQVYIYPTKGYAVLFCTNMGFDILNAPDNDDDIPVQKAGNEVCKKLGQYYLSSLKK